MDDLISRQDAIKAIEKLNIPEDMCVFEILSHIMLVIATLPSADNDSLYKKLNEAHNEGYDVGYWAGRRDYEQKWISCSERLPEKDGRYQVTRYDYVTNTEFIDNLWYEKNLWWNRYSTGDYAVIAWMPLPEPYEAERKEE